MFHLSRVFAFDDGGCGAEGVCVRVVELWSCSCTVCRVTPNCFKMKVKGLDSKLCLMLLVLGLTAGTGTKATTSDTKRDRTYQQDLNRAEYTDNRADGPPKENQLPFYYYNNFDCSKYQYAYGMYADMDFQCQVYHVCHNNRKETFVCPRGTLFNQKLLVCDHWYSVNCQNTPSFYYVNEELGKVSNRTRFDGRARPYSHRRLPQEPTEAQGQFPPYHRGTTHLPYPQPPTETPRDQTGRYYPQPPRSHTTSYGQPQPDQQSRLVPGYGYQPPPNDTQGEHDIYGPRRLGVHGDQLPTTSFPNRYDQRRDHSRRANTTWPADQRNTNGFRYGGQPSRRYGQNYPESSLLGTRYGGHRSVTPRYGQHLPDRTTSVSQDGRFGSQFPPSGVTDNQLPSPGLREQRPPEQVLDRGYGAGFPSGRRDREETQYGRQDPQPGSPGAPDSPHHPFTTHGGQIHSRTRSPGSAYDRQQPTDHGRRPPQARGLGSGYAQHSTFPPQYGRQPPPFGSTRPSYGRQPSRPVYGQQPVSPEGRLSPDHQQGATTIKGPQHPSQVGVRGNGTQQNFTSGFAVRESHTPGSLDPKPRFEYSGHSLNHPHHIRSGYNLEESAALDKKQGVQYGRGPEEVQRPQSWRQEGIQPIGNERREFQYGWQQPGSPRYSFQRPNYRSLLLSRNIPTPHSTPGGDGWNPRNGTGNEAQLGGDYDGSKDKDLKPILVYQRHVPVAINGSSTDSTAVRQDVPVYKVYYVRGDRKEIASK